MPPIDPAVLLVHGAFHGAWCWSELVPRVEALGARCETIDLHRGSLEADVAAVQQAVDALRADGHAAIALGHSLGCSSVSGLDPARLDHVVFLAGPVSGPGLPGPEGNIARGFFEAVTFENDVMTIDRDRAIDLFYADCDPAVAKEAADRLRPNLSYGPPEATAPPLWEAVRSTYLWCEQDAVVEVAYQKELARHMHDAEGFDASHSPMLSRPDELAAAIGRVIERTPAREDA